MNPENIRDEIELFLDMGVHLQAGAKLVYIYLFLKHIAQKNKNPVLIKKTELLQVCGIRGNSSFYHYLKTLEALGVIQQIRRKGSTPSRFNVHYPSEVLEATQAAVS